MAEPAIAVSDRAELARSFTTNIIGKRTTDKTKDQYKSSINTITKAAKSICPAALDDNGVLKFPIAGNDLSMILGQVCFRQDGQLKTFSAVNGYRNALKEKYKLMANTDDIAAFDKIVVPFLEGYQREIAGKKQTGEISSVEGKTDMSHTAYLLICNLALKGANFPRFDINQAVFAHIFCILCWNLMARSVSVSELLYAHLSWSEDALVAKLPKHKGDQDGSQSFSKHIYANISSPAICPILAFGIKVLTAPYISSSDDVDNKFSVFPGSHSESRFSEWLIKMLGALSPAQLLEVGSEIGTIGTHSFRKGVCTYLSSMPGGPPISSIFLRAGWSMGAVQHRYLFEGNGGDQFAGRLAAGLDLNNVNSFCTLPPHFDNTNELPLLTEEEWQVVVPAYNNYPASFKAAIPHVVASVVYHSEWLECNLPNVHPLFLTRFWREGFVDRLRDHVLTGVFRCAVTNMTATGIPPHLVVAHELTNLRSEVRNEMIQMRASMLDLKDANVRQFAELPGAVTNEVLQHAKFEGVVPLTSR